MNWIVQNSYWRLFWRYMYLNWRTESAYLLNYWMLVVSELLLFVTNIVYLYMFFVASGLDNIAGFSMYDFYFVAAMSELLGLITMAFVIPSMVRFKGDIHFGDYDFVLMRPKVRFITNIRSSWLATNVLNYVYIALMVWYVSDKISIDLMSIDLLFVIALLVYGLLLYSLIHWTVGMVALYIHRFGALQGWVNVSGDIMDYPRKVYPKWVSWVYRTILPMMLVINPIFDLIDGNIDWMYFVHMFLVLVMFWLIVLILWKDGIRRYESAA